MVGAQDFRRKIDRGAMTLKWVKILGIVTLMVSLNLWNCHTVRPISSSEVAEKSPKYVLNQLQKSYINTTIFNAKGRIKYDDGDTRVSFSANIRMKRDSFIWMNANLLGFEVARIFIRPDSVFAINRYEKSYLAESYSEFDQAYRVPVAFEQLQDLLLGNSLIDLDQEVWSSFISPVYHLKQSSNPYQISHTIDGRRFVPLAMKVIDDNSGYEVDAKLDEYRAVDKSSEFSYFRHYIINKNNIQIANIQINYSEIDTKTEKRTPFEIPDNYQRAD